MKKEILTALQWRYATKVFDSNKKASEEDIKTILESGRLAPSSYGIEAWKFLVIKNPELRQQIRVAAYNQAQTTDASHLIVIARRTDVENLTDELVQRTAKTQNMAIESLASMKQMVGGGVQARIASKTADVWVAAQTYIALGMMLETAALLGIDTCPMEGFDPQAVDKILNLPAQNLTATTLLTLGYRGEDKAGKRLKVRREWSEVVEER